MISKPGERQKYKELRKQLREETKRSKIKSFKHLCDDVDMNVWGSIYRNGTRMLFPIWHLNLLLRFYCSIYKFNAVLFGRSNLFKQRLALLPKPGNRRHICFLENYKIKYMLLLIMEINNIMSNRVKLIGFTVDMQRVTNESIASVIKVWL